LRSDEDFLAAIRARPSDDTARLIYADWLEERGDSRAEYLRIDIALARLSDPAPEHKQVLERFLYLNAALDTNWLERVGKRCDLVLVSVRTDRMIETFKAFRFATGLGLREAKDVIINTPREILRGVLRMEAETTKQKFLSCSCGYTGNEYPFDPNWVALEIRPVSHRDKLTT